MSILIFIAVLVLLILVHELGHFLAAKFFGVRVDEFGLGFPPKILTLGYWRETAFTLNAIPFGGFVKIFGEDPDEESTEGPDSNRSFVNQAKPKQAVILAAGVFFNFLLAWLFLSIGLWLGIQLVEAPTSSAERWFQSDYLQSRSVVVGGVMENSPAHQVGIKGGDRLIEARYNEEVIPIEQPGDVDRVLKKVSIEPFELVVERAGEEISQTVSAAPLINFWPPETFTYRELFSPSRLEPELFTLKVGLYMVPINEVSMSPVAAVGEGLIFTGELTGLIAVELTKFVSELVTADADLEQVAGPVGIVGHIGEAAEQGLTPLLWFVALISLHLTLINLLPFPALDGGRLLFVAIEAVKGSPMNPKVANALNTFGFLLLIILMVLITVNDISNLDYFQG